jgi:4-amino-4-deoxy-L-arabinose transferase-like glycosyltransferase
VLSLPHNTQRFPKLPRTPHLWMALPLGLALGLGTYRLGAKSLWWDEGFSVWLARLSWPVAWQAIRNAESNMMLYYVLLHFWLRLGLSEIAIRSLSTLAAVACIVPFYFLGVRLLGPRYGILASSLLASNAFFVRQAQEARAYSLVLLLTIGSSLLFLRAIDRPTWWRWAAYAIVSALAVYAHFFAVWVLMAQFLAAMLVPDRSGLRALFVGVQALVAVALVPLAIFASHRYGALAWVPRPTMATLVSFGNELTGSAGVALTVLYLILCGAFVLAVWRPARPEATRESRWHQTFVVIWLALPILGSLLVSWVLTPIFFGRFLFIAVAPLALAAAGGMRALRPGWLRLAAAVCLFALGFSGLRRWYSTGQKEEWRAAMAYVLARAMPGDGIAFRQAGGRWTGEYYVERLRPGHAPLLPLFPSAPWGSLKPADMTGRFQDWWRTRPTSGSRVWVVERVLRGTLSSESRHVRPPEPPDPGPGSCIQDVRSFYRVRVSLYVPAPC